VRGLVWNPVFALLPAFYLKRLAAAGSRPAAAGWLVAFLVGFPHAGYTALEIRHYIVLDGVADGRTRAQLGFFGSYMVFGGALAVWYVERGASVLGTRLRLDPRALMAPLSLAGSAGAVMGLQDVLVMDIALRPRSVLRAAAGSVLRWRWLRLTLPWAAAQWLLARALHFFR
jgi:hypothetical protein